MSNGESEETKPCIACAEDIKKDARLCRFCKTAQDDPSIASTPETVNPEGRGQPNSDATTTQTLATKSLDAKEGKFRLGCLGWSVVIVGVSVLAGVLLGWTEQAAEERERDEFRAEQELENKFRETLDGTCLEDLRTWEPGTQRLWTFESSRWPDRVEARGAIFDEAGERLLATCDYNFVSLEEPNFTLNRITIKSEDGARSATYLPGAEPERTSVEVSSECGTAMQDAAQVPLSRDNNLEVMATGDACTSVEEWWLAVKQHPNAFGANEYPDDEKWIYLATLCGVADGSAVCRDAEAQGLR